MNFFDILILLLMIFIIAASARKGLLRSLLNIIALGAAAAVSKIFSYPAAEYVYGNFVQSRIIDKFYEVLPSGSVQGEINTGIQNLLDSLPSVVTSIAKSLELYPENINAGGSQNWSVERIESVYVAPFATGVLKAVLAVLIFVVAALLFRIIAHMINKIMTKKEHKLFSRTNTFLGGCLGAVRSVVPAGFICALMSLIAPILNNDVLNDLIDSSFFCGIIEKIIT